LKNVINIFVLFSQHFRRIVSIGVLGICYVSLLRLFISFPSEDAFITFRYVKHLLQGYGLVFNIGQAPIEGYSNFLWLLCVAITQLVFNINVIYVSLILSVLFTLITVILLIQFYPHKENSFRIKFVITICILLNPLWLYWTYSGMETALFSFLITLTILVAMRVSDSWKDLGILAIVEFLLFLCRMDGVLIILGIGICFILQKKYKTLWKTSFFLSVFLVPYLMWKLWYFGNIFPNPFYLRITNSSLFFLNILRGLEYVVAFFNNTGLIIFILSLFSVIITWNKLGLEKRKFLQSMTLPLLLYCLFIIVIGGDFYEGFRYLIPLFPIFLCVVITTTTLQFNYSPKIQFISFLIIILALFFSPASYVRNLDRRNDYFYIAQISNKIFPSKTTIALSAIGAFGYYTDFELIDTLGVVDSHIANSSASSIHAVAHEKGDGGYVLSQNPDVIFVDTFYFKSYPFSFSNVNQGFISDEEIVRSQDFKKNYQKLSVRIPQSYFLKQDKSEPEYIKDFVTFQDMYLGMYVKRDFTLLSIQCVENSSEIKNCDLVEEV